MRDDPAVVALVTRARNGDRAAWHELVKRYAPLVWSICRRHQLSRADADDVGGSVWLRLVEQLGALREPAALPGWIATTTDRECQRVRRVSGRGRGPEGPVDLESFADGYAVVEEAVLTEERNIALRAAFEQLPEPCRRLLSMLMQSPPLSYAEISRRLRTPIGSIGPNRHRCLSRMRESPVLAALINAEREHSGWGDTHGQAVVGR